MSKILKQHKGWAWATLALVLFSAPLLMGAAISGRSLRFKPQNTPATLIPGPEEGECAWNDSTNVLQCYNGSTWVDVGAGSGNLTTLDLAYDGLTGSGSGRTCTVDQGAVTFTGSHATNAVCAMTSSATNASVLDLDVSGTFSGNIIDIAHDTGNGIPILIAKSAGSGDSCEITTSGTNTGIPFQINHAVGNTTGLDIVKSGGSGDACVITSSGTNTGALLTLAHAVGDTAGLAVAKSGGSGDAIDLTSSGTQTGILLDINQVVGNAVAVDIDKSSNNASGAVTIDVTGGTGIPLALGTDQNIGVMTLTKAGAGAGAMIALSNSGTGNDITADNWTITKAGVFTGTTGGGFSGDETHTCVATTGTGFDFDGRTITTGTGLRVRYDESTCNGGFAFAVYANDAVANDFTIGEDGATVITGNAAGTDALTVTAGDFRMTSGHAILTAGNFTQDDGIAIFEDETGTVTQVLLDHKAGNLASTTAVLKLDDGGNPASGANMLRLEPTGTPAAGSIGIEFVGASKVMQAMYLDSDITADSVAEFNAGGVLADNKAVLELISDGARAAGSAVLRVAPAGTPAAATSYGADFDFTGQTNTNNPVGMILQNGDTTADTLLVTATGAIADNNGVARFSHVTGAIANGGAVVRIEGNAAAAGATAYGLILNMNAANLEAISVEAGTSSFAETITSTGGGIVLNDTVPIGFGTASGEGSLTSDGSDILWTATGGLFIGDGTNANAVGFDNAGVMTIKGTGDAILEDTVALKFGTAGLESNVASDGANTEWTLSSGALQIGDGASTNCVQFANATGAISFLGTARPTKTLFYGAREFQPEGANPAVMTVATHAVGWGLDPASDEAVTLSFKVPDNWVAATDVTYRIAWAANDVNQTVVRWEVITVPLAEDELTSGAGNSDAVEDTEISATAYDLNWTAATTIGAGAEWAAGDLVFLTVNRDANHANDTLAVDAIFLGIEINYTAGSP